MTAAAHGSFDFVVVGSGSGGSVVARRLVDAGASVAVIEAGGQPSDPAIHDPGRWPELPGSPADKLPSSELCPPNSPCYRLPDNLIVGGAGVTMDLTDEIMRALGQDPYRVQKARFLAATFEFRMSLAVAAHREDMRKSLDKLPDALAELWGDSRYSALERRRVLFELWRETSGTPEGTRAGHIIERFIQRQLPCGSPDAYTRAELQAFQRREPGRAFSPYGACER